MKRFDFLVLIFVASVNAATIAPGVPEPWTNWDRSAPDRPGDWSSEVAGYYFVQDDGTDTGRTYGTPTAPRRTIPRPIPAGSRVEVSGLYNRTTGGTTFVEGYGTQDTWSANTAGPVFVVSCATNQAIFSVQSLAYGTNLYLQGIKWTNTTGTSLQIGSSSTDRPSDYLVVRDCEFAGDGATTHSAFVVTGRATGWSINVVQARNWIHDYGDINSLSDIDCLWVATSTYVSNFWTHANIAARMVGGGRLGSSSIGADSSLSIRQFCSSNYVYDGKQNGITLKYGQDVVFSSNTISNITDNGGGLSPGKGIAGQYNPQNVWLIFNRIYGPTRYGIDFPSGDSGERTVYILGNVISGVRATGTHSGASDAEAGIMMRGGYNAYIVANTIFDCDRAYGSPGGSGDSRWMENNIFSVSSLPANSHIVYIENSPNNSTFRNNILWNTDSPNFKVRWGATTYTDLAIWSAAATGDSGNLNSDPLLDDGALQVGSPAIGAALADSSLTQNLYALYETTFGVPIRVDFIGTDRPQNVTWDIGAYELAGAPTITFIADQFIQQDTDTGAIAFTVGDDVTAAGDLTLDKDSSNTTLAPLDGIVFGGSGASRTVTITPAAGQTGTSTITVTVTDADMQESSRSFLLTVNATPSVTQRKGKAVRGFRR